jgi:hypothetical protein
MHRPLLPTAALALVLVPGSLLAGCGESPPDTGSAPAESAAPAESSTAPARTSWLEFERESHDFGDVYQAAVRRTSFDLVAAGTEPLVVTALKRSCGCTEGELFVVDATGTESPVELDRPYAPGTKFKLLATLNTKGRQGTQLQRVHVVTRGDVTTSFMLEAEIVTFLEFDSTELPEASALTGLDGEVIVRSRGGEHFGLDARHDVLPEDLAVEFTALEPDEAGQSDRWAMSFRILPGVAKGPFKRKVILMTDAVNEEAEPFSDGSPAVHLGEMWIRTSVEGVFDVRPERLDFGRMLPGQRVTKKILVRSRDTEFDMADIRVALFERVGGEFAYSDAFKVSARAIDPGQAWEIEIQAQDIPVAGAFGGILGVKLDHRYEPDVQIPFTGQSVSPPN